VRKNEFIKIEKKNKHWLTQDNFKNFFLMAMMLVFWKAMTNREAMLQVALTFLLTEYKVVYGKACDHTRFVTAVIFFMTPSQNTLEAT
jgi:hypothetical protein